MEQITEGEIQPYRYLPIIYGGQVSVHHESQVAGYTAQRRADSNGILHMGNFVNAHWQVEVFGEADSPSRRGCAYSVTGAQ